MAEHVGVRKFQSFLAQVRGMLEDDDIFFLQIAGLRQTWQWEGFISGLSISSRVLTPVVHWSGLSQGLEIQECRKFKVVSSVWFLHWDFQFCGSGYFFDRFYGFCVKRRRFFGFGVQCGLRIFRFLASGFRFS